MPQTAREMAAPMMKEQMIHGQACWAELSSEGKKISQNTVGWMEGAQEKKYTSEYIVSKIVVVIGWQDHGAIIFNQNICS